MMQRLIDWLAEPRAPHHVLTWYRRSRRYQDLPRPGSSRAPVSLVLSFDVEQDPEPPFDHHRCETCPPFLEWLDVVAGQLGWRTTLFVQGSIVDRLGPSLRRLRSSHELGLHGYFHELWGRRLWFAPYAAAPPRWLRRALLEEGIRAFERNGLPRPRAFRAPNLVCDDTTLDLLVDAGFEIDSSVAAYRGAEPVVARRGRLTRVPVSASPRPVFHRWRGTPIPSWAPYRTLNLQLFLTPSVDTLVETIDEILAVQGQAGSPRHLVVLAHPWEFADVPLAGCTRGNYNRLIERVRMLGDRLPLEVVPLGKVAGQVEVGA